MTGMASSSLLVLSREVLMALADPAEMIGAMAVAARALAQGALEAPARSHVHAAGATLLTMPVALPDEFGCKLVAVARGNPARGLPTTQGVMLLFDGATGSPVALLDAGALTCQRTGAIAALAIDRLSASGLDRIGLVGCGEQGAWAMICAASIRPLREVLCVSRSDAAFARFLAMVARYAPTLNVERVNTPGDLAHLSCVVTATTSSAPVVPDEDQWLAGKLLVSIGSYRPEMRELPLRASALAGAIIVDSPDAAREVGDVILPLESGTIAPNRVFGLTTILDLAERPSLGTTLIFKCVGHAAYDLFAARQFVTAAMLRASGERVNL
jgi:ornithine cyclodeaminase/alanine dehydrogenase-like protein (mu-crystallin family)